MADARFPRSARLHEKADFQRLFARSDKIVDQCFTVRYRCNQLSHARLGLAVSRRTSKCAVERNRIKRVVRESFRRHRRRLPGLDVIVISRSSAAGRGNKELFSSLIRHWNRLETASCVLSCSA